MLPLQNKFLPLPPHIDVQAWKQVKILASKSAIFKIQRPNRLVAVLFWIGITLLGICYPFTIGLAIFTIGFFNYVLLLSFRLSNNFTRKSSATENRALQEPVIWPSFSVIVPLKEEDDVIHATLQAFYESKGHALKQATGTYRMPKVAPTKRSYPTKSGKSFLSYLLTCSS